MRRLRTRERALAALLLLCGCEPVEPCGDSDFVATTGGLQGPTLEAVLRERFPAFADAPLTSPGAAPSHEHVDVLFVSEGFKADELPGFRDEADALATRFDGDVLGAAFPQAFRFHRLEVASASNRVKNAVLDDTALGACLRRGDDGSLFWRLANPEPLELLRLRFPEVDALVVLINGDEGRSNAELGFVSDRSRPHVVRQRRGDGVSVLTHELGHALFSLGDEYWDLDAPLPADRKLRGPDDPLVETANLSTAADGAKWRGLVEGAQPGGAQYRRDVWHPTSRCRMLNAAGGDPFCPVCRHAIEHTMAVFNGSASPATPSCGVLGPEPLTLNNGTFRLVTESPGTIWLRVGCDAPCPPQRPPEVIKAGIGWIHTNPPEGWSEHQLACLLDCRYPGDAPQREAVTPTSATSAPASGHFEVRCSNDAGAMTRLVPYGP